VAFVWSVATALPSNRLTAEELKQFGREFFAGSVDAAQFDKIVDNTEIDERYLLLPIPELAQPRLIDETCRIYSDGVRELGGQALRKALAAAGLTAKDVDAIVVCTSTGFMIPSLDAYLINECGLQPTTRRYPFTTLGCAGGAGGLTRGAELTAAGHATVAVVAVEVPTITFRSTDRSMTNIVSSTLFGDGAAAVILRDRPPKRPTVRVRATRSFLHPESYDVMGFDLEADGFRVVLRPDVPDRAVDGLPELVSSLAREANATARDLTYFVLHPGGRRVLDKLEEALGLTPKDTALTRDVLRRHGNMSAPTVLFVLARLLEAGGPAAGTLGLMAAFGPGFSAELALLEGVRP
jgi:alkylresorcinol/alkylpyrone synthase